ncbi:glycosyltransferase family 4 protein [Niastella caeni]|uniref:Glycosyltransferase family 4 protein n=1 Tax=Niastella caeni TaxID=2569763 RepID=A0A4S8HUS0_9BACT|nr:glycosyltransferase family 4 protein [Niastella caeni]THU39357.1 glycosyltransferase family 4 protein [Niastella caeni]
MKVLFVCSGNSKNFSIIPFIKEQGESLKSAGIELEYYTVVGKGLMGYVRSGLQLRKFLKRNKYDLIHAHFTYSGWTALIGAGRKMPVVLSLMGTDATGEYIGKNKVNLHSRILTFLTWMIQPFVKAIISKSPNIEASVYRKHKSFIIPNGVNMQKFSPNLLQANKNGSPVNGKKKVLFLGNKDSPGKNFPLAQAAIQQLENVELLCPYPVAHNDVPLYLNEADVLVLPSFMEGSPNVIKEAMACNCPIVSTDVGDVKWVIGETIGCYLASFDVKDFANKIQLAINTPQANGRTNGRQRIMELGLDMETVAKRLMEVYQKSLDN